MSSPVITICEIYDGGKCEVVTEGNRAKIKGCTLGYFSESVYFIINNEILHVSQLPGSSIAKVYGNVVCWKVPSNVIAGTTGFKVSLGINEPVIKPFRVSKEITENKDLDEVTETDDINMNELLNRIKRRELRFRYFGNEGTHSERYLNVGPGLIDEFTKNLSQCGLEWRIEKGFAETLVRDPTLEYLRAIASPSENSRSTALYIRIVTSYELWVLSETIKALRNAGGKPLSNKVLIPQGQTYTPAITLNFGNKCVHTLYQVSIITNTAGGMAERSIENPCIPKWFTECVSKCGIDKSEETHVTPDIILMVTDCDEELSLVCRWPFYVTYDGRMALAQEEVAYIRRPIELEPKALKSRSSIIEVLTKADSPPLNRLLTDDHFPIMIMPLTWQYSEKIPLIIEAKFSLHRASSARIAIKQVCMYKCLLRNKPRIAVVIHDSVDNKIKTELMKVGATVIDGLAPGNETKINELLSMLRNSLKI